MRLRAEELPHAGMCGDGIGNQPALRQLRDEVMQLGESEKQIDFGNLLRKLLLVALHQATDGDDRLDSTLFQLRRGQDGIDRFLLRGVDETAGVHQNDVRLRQHRGHHGAVPNQIAHEAFGIDRRLVAAEGNDAELHPR